MPQHLLLIGGGHSHVAVLADWARHGMPCDRATLLTPYPTLRYSGTVPGWIAGQYARDFGLVNLAGLAKRAGVDMVLDRCEAIDPDARMVTTAGGESIAFEVASIDTGGVGLAHSVLGDDARVIDIRPIDGFVTRLVALPATARIAVVGGGAGGVELAFALKSHVESLIFFAGKQGLLPDFSEPVRDAVAKELARQGIECLAEDARIEGGELKASDRSLEPVQAIIAALGSGAPEWPGAGGLATDAQGFIAVDRFQRSASHPHIFAAGDVAAREDCSVPHSGVHAVHTGPVLAANLRSVMRGEEPHRSYTPRPASLYLLSTGRGEAIASYGPLAAKGRWARQLKHWIDNRWLAQYAALVQGR